MYVTSTIDWAIPATNADGDLDRDLDRDRNDDQREPITRLPPRSISATRPRPIRRAVSSGSEHRPDAVRGEDQTQDGRLAPRGRG